MELSMRTVGNIPQGTLLYQGRYRIELLLARTPHRAIYRALNLARNRPATIVELAASDEQHVTTALERAAPLVQFDHHTLTSFQVVFVEDDTVYIGLAFAGGQTIEHIMLDRTVPIQAGAAVRWISQAAEMLEYFDQALPDWHLGDLSQGALFVTSEDHVQLLGFEIPLGLLTPAQVAGELPVGATAPEMRQGQCDARSDVYGLAATLHLLLTAQAWTGGDPAANTALDNAQPELPRPLVTVIRRALRVDPAERWADVPAFHGALLAAMATRETSAPQADEWWLPTAEQPLPDEPNTLITDRRELQNAIVHADGQPTDHIAEIIASIPADMDPGDTLVPASKLRDATTQEVPLITSDTADSWAPASPPVPAHEEIGLAGLRHPEPALPQRDEMGSQPSLATNAAALSLAPTLLDNLAPDAPPPVAPTNGIDDVQPLLDITWAAPPEGDAAVSQNGQHQHTALPIPSKQEDEALVLAYSDLRYDLVAADTQPKESAPAWADPAPVEATPPPTEPLFTPPPVNPNGPLVSFLEIPVIQAVPPAPVVVPKVVVPTIPVVAEPEPVLPEPTPATQPLFEAPVVNDSPVVSPPPVAFIPPVVAEPPAPEPAPRAEQLIVAHSAPPILPPEPPATPPPTTSKTPSRPLLDRVRDLLKSPSPNTPTVATGTIVVPRHMYPQHSYNILVRLQCRITRKLTDQPSDAATTAIIEVEASSDAFYLPVKKVALPIPLDGRISEASLAVTAQRASPNGTDRMVFTFTLNGHLLHRGNFVADIAILNAQQTATGSQMLTLVHPLDITL